MVNFGRPKSQGGQFFLCLAPCPQLDGRNVAFGRVVAGLEVLERLGRLGRADGTPSQRVEVADCGVIPVAAGESTTVPSKALAGGLEVRPGRVISARGVSPPFSGMHLGGGCGVVAQ